MGLFDSLTNILQGGENAIGNAGSSLYNSVRNEISPVQKQVQQNFVAPSIQEFKSGVGFIKNNVVQPIVNPQSSLNQSVQNFSNKFNQSPIVNNPISKDLGFGSSNRLSLQNPQQSAKTLGLGVIGGGPEDLATAAEKEASKVVPEVQGALENKTPKVTETQGRSQLTGQASNTPNSILKAQATPSEAFTNAAKTVKGSATKLTKNLPEDINIAQASTEAAGNGFKGLDQTTQKAFQDWANSRRVSEVSSVITKEPFKALDSQGMDAIKAYQQGDRTGGLEDVEKYFEGKFQQLQSAGINLGHKDNYLAQVWDNTPEQIQQVGRKLGWNKSFTQPSLIQDYEAGIKAGLKPKYNTISGIVGHYDQQVNNALADKKFFDYLSSQGMVQPKNPGGWKAYDANAFPTHTLSYTDQTGKNIQHSGLYYGPPNLTNLVNNILKEPDQALQAVAHLASGAKNTLLTTGIPGTAVNIHGFNTLARAATSSPLLGAKALGYMFAPKLAANEIAAHMPELLSAVKDGMTYTSEEHVFDKAYDNVFSGALGKTRDFLSQHFSRPLFQQMIPALKLSLYNSTKADMIARGFAEDEAGKAAALLANERFGGLNLEQIGRNKNFQNILRTFLLAPDFQETGLGLGRGMVKGFLKPGEIASKSYRAVAIGFISSYVAFNLLNKQLTGHYMWDNEPGHEFDVAVGKSGDGKTRYIRPYGSAFDMVRLPGEAALAVKKGNSSGIFSDLRNRTSTILGSAISLLSNTDYLGNQLYGISKQTGLKIPLKQEIGNIGNQVIGGALGVPQAIQAAINYGTGKQNGEESIAQGLGLPLHYSNAGAASYANLRQQLQAALPTTKDSSAFQLIAYSDRDGNGNPIVNSNPLSTQQKADIFLNYPAVLSAMTQLEKSQPSHDPFYDLTAAQQHAVLLQEAADSPVKTTDVSNIYNQPWYQQLEQARTTYYNSLPTQAPTPSQQTSTQLMQQDNALTAAQATDEAKRLALGLTPTAAKTTSYTPTAKGVSLTKDRIKLSHTSSGKKPKLLKLPTTAKLKSAGKIKAPTVKKITSKLSTNAKLATGLTKLPTAKVTKSTTLKSVGLKPRAVRATRKIGKPRIPKPAHPRLKLTVKA